jgi:SAM-dependent methyltransferase
MKLKFWFKTALYLLIPGGYGYPRYLRRYYDSVYVHERDKHAVRKKHHGTEGWKEQKNGNVAYRDYNDYAEYVTHQQQKFEEILRIEGGFSNKVIVSYRLKFYRRFKLLHQLIPRTACIVCAGARQGTEVEVLRDLGFSNAYGIDLNPGPENPFVRWGDFMHMDNKTSSVDLVYTNCVDHVFNLNEFFAEHARVIKPDGYVLYDLSLDVKSSRGSFETVCWESEEDIFLIMLRYFKMIVRLENEEGWKWILLRGKKLENRE